MSFSVKSTGVIIIAGCLSFAANAQFSVQVEKVTNIRYEQYVGAFNPIKLFRLPSPGVTTFPGGSCTSLSVPTTYESHGSRFMAAFINARNNDINLTYVYNTASCTLTSFGVDGS